ncbi:ADP-ribosylglycohydrolase family protein [Arthrobacter antibioticus]|uniref:ADP-ribosylglycohydrolase family protein n=1 Tax=Arthrobacter sp. H35-MC1 TaxID=3046203 RepID=UPI0024BA29E5|nr:ADP-ribosylglycohydrolase family protein [Arthrobacter sp. H35-MC1]MDJ0316346.1 ADP-ribosylglycohydrolase family protein [Arthrobacter sp. H35-MC1]
MTIPAGPVSTPPTDFATRVQGTLMGGALGDAFGYLVEFDSLAEIAAKYGPALLVDLSQARSAAHFSDDTQMTLYTLDGLLDVLEWANQGVGADINACQWLAYLRWLKTQDIATAEHAPAQSPRWIDSQSVLHHQRHPGNACITALATGEMGTTFRPVNPESKGCGTVMRSAPYGLLPNLEAETIYKISSDAASLTHGHPSARQSAGAFSWLIHQLVIGGLSLRAAAESALARAVAETGADPHLLSRLETALLLSLPTHDANDAVILSGDALTDALGLGWVGEEAMAVALYSVLVTFAKAPSPVEHFLLAIRLAANHSGDSDSTASIAGNILGAFYGEAALPPSWLALCEAPHLIRHLGAEFIKLTTGH